MGKPLTKMVHAIFQYYLADIDIYKQCHWLSHVYVFAVNANFGCVDCCKPHKMASMPLFSHIQY